MALDKRTWHTVFTSHQISCGKKMFAEGDTKIGSNGNENSS